MLIGGFQLHHEKAILSVLPVLFFCHECSIFSLPAYSTVSGVNGPLVILDNVKVRLLRCSVFIDLYVRVWVLLLIIDNQNNELEQPKNHFLSH